MDQRLVVEGALLIAGSNAAPVLQAVDPPFRPTPQPIQGSVEERGTSALRAPLLALPPLVLALGDEMGDAAAAEQLPARWEAVTPIEEQAVRPFTRATPGPPHPHRVEDWFELGAIMPLTGGQDEPQEPPAAVKRQVQLGAEAAAAPAEGFVGKRPLPPFPRPPRVGAPARPCYPRSSRPRRVLDPRRLAPAAPGAGVPSSRLGPSGGAGRGRCARSHTREASRARAPRCGRSRGCR